MSQKNFNKIPLWRKLHALTMRQYREAFPSVYQLYAGALTIAVSTAACENSFSKLKRVLRPYRRSMGHERKVQLVLMAFEKTLTIGLYECQFGGLC